MLVLTRRFGETLCVGDNLELTPLSCRTKAICCLFSPDGDKSTEIEFNFPTYRPVDMGDGVLVEILGVKEGQIKFGVSAPSGIKVDRKELRLLKRHHAGLECAG